MADDFPVNRERRFVERLRALSQQPGPTRTVIPAEVEI